MPSEETTGSINEEKKSTGDISFHEELNNKYEKWINENYVEGGNFYKALSLVENIKPVRSKEAQTLLVSTVAQICFAAANYSTKLIPDRAADQRNLVRQLQKDIKVQERAISDFESFSRDYSEELEGIFCLDEGLSGLTTEDFRCVLSVFKDGLRRLEHTLTHDIEQCWRVMGALEFKSPLKRQAYTKQPEVNSLLFTLTLLFRGYTNPKFSDDNWLELTFAENPVPMPSFGDPLYSITEGLTQAVLTEVAMVKAQKDAEWAKKRVLRLMKNEATLRHWYL